MESFRNEVKIQQGEDWNLDILLSASDRKYIPYIVNSIRTNPFFVITVASTKFEKNLRYVKSFWCDIKGNKTPTEVTSASSTNTYNLPCLPTFYNNSPIECGDLAVGHTLPVTPGSGEFSTYTAIDNTLDANNNRIRNLYSYVDKNDNDKTKYFYFAYNDSNECLGRVDDYECKVTFNFNYEITGEWNAQNYMYQITLVSGVKMKYKLDEIYLYHLRVVRDITEDEWPTKDKFMQQEGMTESLAEQLALEAQYKYVKEVWPNELQPDIDIDSPLGKIENPEPILPPTRLEVYNNLRTLI